MTNPHLVIVVALAWAARAGAACVAEGPLETARWIHSNERSFAFQQTGRDLSSRTAFLSPKLYALLRAEWRCQDAEEGLCALDSDPWLNAQDGEELDPVAFSIVSRTDAAAIVRMSYRFGWKDAATPRPVPAEAKLELIRDAATGCWLLDDLIGRDDRSLKKQLQDYPHDA
jgi:hypothetical protein